MRRHRCVPEAQSALKAAGQGGEEEEVYDVCLEGPLGPEF